jgi:RNA polymerase sigma factor (sigma-70 family)
MEEGTPAVESRVAFFSKWEEYEKLLLGYALRILSNVTDAEDVARQALTNYVASMDRRVWNVQIESTQAYLKVIARNLCFALLRRRGRETPLESRGEQGERTLKALEEKAMRENDPTSRYQKKIEKDENLGAVPKVVSSKLTEEEEDIYYMHFSLNLGVKQIAAALDKDVDYTRYQVNKLKAKIRYRVKAIKQKNARQG